MENLNAKSLKNALWSTLNELKGDKCDPGKADAIASQAREILRTVNTQLKIAAQSHTDISADVVGFGNNSI